MEYFNHFGETRKCFKNLFIESRSVLNFNFSWNDSGIYGTWNKHERIYFFFSLADVIDITVL